jgi:hypothetical protein
MKKYVVILLMLSVSCKQYQTAPSWNTCEQYEYIYTLPENKNKPCVVEQIIYNDVKAIGYVTPCGCLIVIPHPSFSAPLKFTIGDTIYLNR